MTESAYARLMRAAPAAPGGTNITNARTTDTTGSGATGTAMIGSGATGTGATFTDPTGTVPADADATGTGATGTASTADARVDPAPRQHVRDAFRRTPAWIHVALAAVVAVTVVVVLAQPWFAPTDLVRDSQSVAATRGDASPAYGLVSNLGIVVLVMAAGTLVAAIAIVPPGAASRRLLAWSLALSLVFALDDLLLLHETAAFGPGSGTVLAAAYAAGFIVFALHFRDTILERFEPSLLAVVFTGLGASAIVDVLVEPATRLSVIVEDGAKLLGVLAWSTFVVRAAIVELRADRATWDLAAKVPATAGRAAEGRAEPRATADGPADRP